MATGGKSLDDDDSWKERSIDEFQKLETDDKLVELFKLLCSLNTRVKNIEEHCVEDTVPKEQDKPIHQMLCIGALNIRSLKKRYKYKEFSDIIAGCDILCCTETLLKVSGKTNTVDIDGYDFFSQARKQMVVRASGGIGCYVKTSLSSNHVNILESPSDYVMWLYISKAITHLGDDLLIGIVYIPPYTSDYYGEEHMQQLSCEISQACKYYRYVFLTGDMNARTANVREIKKSTFAALTTQQIKAILPDKSYIERISRDTKLTNDTGEWLIEICKQNKLFILNGRFGKDKYKGRYTKDKSVLDYSIAAFSCLECLKDFEITKTNDFDGHAMLKTIFEFKV